MKTLPLALLCVSSLPLLPAMSADPIKIRDRLELFADDFLIESISGDLTQKVHEPTPQNVVFSADATWEGNTSGYYSLFRDGDTIRMIYRGWAHQPEKPVRALHREFTCYAESRDGLNFTKPKLGLVEWEGSKDNNIILDDKARHNFFAFLDDNPAAPPEARYKGIGGEKKDGGLCVYQSPDAIHWKKLTEEPVISDGAFDSQNLAFWDPHAKVYRAYYRIFSEGGTDGGEWKPKGVRAIRTSTSTDYVHWEPGTDVTYSEGTPEQQLYTNAVQPYFRAPHLLIGFPTRYLPDEGERVEPVFMISRNGVQFTRYNDPVIPESAPADRAGNRSNYMTRGMFTLPGKPDEISVYATEAYYGLVPGRVRRFTYRLDGFVSLRAGEKGGEMVTKPLAWIGKSLGVNAAMESGGSLQVELQDEGGKALPGFALADCDGFAGDDTAAKITWGGSSDLSPLAGKPVRVRFVLSRGDLYSMRFQ
jgi:hypothetical protein